MTGFLAQVIGWYFIITACFLIVRRNELRTIITHLMNNDALIVVIGSVTLIIGLLLVIAHNHWALGWPLIITLIAWVILLAGLLRLFVPELGIKLAKAWIKNPKAILITALIYLIIGLFLLYNVYFRL